MDPIRPAGITSELDLPQIVRVCNSLEALAQHESRRIIGNQHVPIQIAKASQLSLRLASKARMDINLGNPSEVQRNQHHT